MHARNIALRIFLLIYLPTGDLEIDFIPSLCMTPGEEAEMKLNVTNSSKSQSYELKSVQWAMSTSR